MEQPTAERQDPQPQVVGCGAFDDVDVTTWHERYDYDDNPELDEWYPFQPEPW